MVPHLTTALVSPLQDLERRIIGHMPEIERWLRRQWQEHQVPFYTSVDLRNADEVVGLNRKQRNKMAVVKEGLEVSSVLIQEGVPTFESINDAIAEPVVYMIDRFVVGGFYRVHTARGKEENLNAPGAQFVPLAFESPCIPDLNEPADCAPNRFYAYGVVARLAQLAASIEIEELEAGAFAEPVTA